MVDINQALLNIVALGATFVVGAVAFAVLYAGYLFIFSGDNPDQMRRAKMAIGAAVIGLVFVVGAVSFAGQLNTAVRGGQGQQQQQQQFLKQPAPVP